MEQGAVSKQVFLPPFLEKKTLDGPQIRKLQMRARGFWLAASLIGLGLAFAAPPHLAAFGVGLVLPGAGLLYAGHPVLAVITLPLMVAACFVWLLMGIFVAPLIVWGGAAALAGGLITPGGEWAWAAYLTPVTAVGIVAQSTIRRRRSLPAKREALSALNRHITAQPLPKATVDWTIEPALDAQDIGAMRFMLDLALQPLDSWKGFTTKDQFREAAWRYQLYSLGEALGSLRATRLPAFRGYLQQAQYNASYKMVHRKVWDYWFWESLWGNLRIQRDPMIHENIMITGWYALQLGVYQITTGDRTFDQPGSLPFRWDEKTCFEYSYPKIADALVRNFGKKSLMLYPCEPNWVFAYCNDQGMAGLRLYDQVHGTDHAGPLLDVFRRRSDEEFTTADGKAVTIVANRAGFCISDKGATGRTVSGWLRSVYARDMAHRDWEQMRHLYVGKTGDELLEVTSVARVDPGDYTMSEGNAFFPTLMQTAREIGDEEVYAWAKRRHDMLGVTETDGALRWPGSTFANLNSHMGRFGARDLWYRMGNVPFPKAWREGPMLEDAVYPEVIVASAWSEGEALHLVVEPGAGPTRTTLGFSQLKPSCRYLVVGPVDEGARELVADAHGKATLSLPLDGRLTLLIRPA